MTRTDERLLMPLTILVLAVVLLQCVVGIAPDIYWDVDPRSPSSLPDVTIIGPAIAAWLNVLSAALATAVLFVHVRAGGRVHAPSLVLAGLGAAACAWHARESIEDFRQAGMWIGAISLGLAAFHLARHDRPRRLMAAALIGILMSMVLGAIAYIYYDFKLTIEHFYKNEKEILQARGWVYGSAQHELYKRRLESPDATGPFGLSNVFGSIAGAMTLMALAAGWGLVQRRRWKMLLLPALVVMGGLFTIYLTHSKGAAVVFAACLGLFAWTVLAPKLARPAAVTLMVLAFVAVLARGAMGPPQTHEGERSILFRYHYWQAAGRMLLADPVAHGLLGTGVRGFSQAYLQHKNPLNPEDVTSAHNVFVDWITMLGVGGLAWSALLVLWLWRSGAPPPPPVMTDDADARVMDGDVAIVLLLGALVFGIGAIFKGVTLGSEVTWLSYSLGVVLFIGITATLMNPAWLDRRSVSVGLFLAAAMLMIQNQIEMTFFNAGPAAVAIFMIGAAAGGASSAAERKQTRWAMAAPIGLAAVTLLLIVFHALPMARQQHWLGQAARQLKADPTDVMAVSASLDRAWRILPMDDDPLHWQARLRVEGMWKLAQQNRFDEGLRLADETLALLDRSTERDGAAIIRLKAQVQDRAGQWFHQPQRRQKAIELMEQAMPLAPYSMDQHLALADMYWQAGRHDDAKRLYKRCLQLSDEQYLDPAKQLTDEQRALIQSRVNQ